MCRDEARKTPSWCLKYFRHNNHQFRPVIIHLLHTVFRVPYFFHAWPHQYISTLFLLPSQLHHEPISRFSLHVMFVFFPPHHNYYNNHHYACTSTLFTFLILILILPYNIHSIINNNSTHPATFCSSSSARTHPNFLHVHRLLRQCT